MLKHGFLLSLLLAVAQAATAQTTYSFSGLAWGESVEIVDSKLVASGFSGCTYFEKIKCKVLSSCVCSFSGGPVESGWVSFENGKLSSVSVRPYDLAAATVALRQKYGSPLPKKDEPRSGMLQKPEGPRWESQNGETLEVNSIGYLVYVSGASNKDAASRSRSDASKF